MPIVRFLPRREGALLDEVWVRPAEVAAIPIVDTDTGGDKHRYRSFNSQREHIKYLILSAC